jgi:hypothetical protein
MTRLYLVKATYLFLICLLMCVVFSFTAQAQLSATPKYIFLDGTHHSSPLSITNGGNDELEVSVEIKYGYVTSDDTGKAIIVSDTAGAEEPSAAAWVKAYPQRFILGVGETQIIRLAAYPPPGLAEGEYWARINVLGRPRKAALSASPNFTSIRGGMSVIMAVGLPFHYRVGKLTTGLSLANMVGEAVGDKINVNLIASRTGNASYWGSRLVRLINSNGKVVFSARKNVAVFKSYFVHDQIDRKDIPAGTYTLDEEFTTNKRSDLRDDILIQSPPGRVSVQIQLP